MTTLKTEENEKTSVSTFAITRELACLLHPEALTPGIRAHFALYTFIQSHRRNQDRGTSI